jgi:hypothetical protein
MATLSWSWMQVPMDMPYWMRSIGRHLRAKCSAEPKLPFEVRLNLLNLVRVEGQMHVLHVYSGLF